MNELEVELERRTLTYTEWNLSATKMENKGWHPITFTYATAGPQKINQIKVPSESFFFFFLTLLLFCILVFFVLLSYIYFDWGRLSTMYTMRLNTGQNGVVQILHMLPAFYLQGSSLVELQCVFWARGWLDNLVHLHYWIHQRNSTIWSRFLAALLTITNLFQQDLGSKRSAH